MIPPTTRGALLDALAYFDRELRAAPEWIEWEQNGTHKYAIEHEGRLYPVKQIIALATGIPRHARPVGARRRATTRRSLPQRRELCRRPPPGAARRTCSVVKRVCPPGSRPRGCAAPPCRRRQMYTGGKKKAIVRYR